MSLCELGCPSLEYVYNMSWAEYLIRLHGYKRQQKRLDYRQRAIMYQTYVSNWMSDKKKPLPINRYWDIEGTNENEIQKGLQALAKAKEMAKNG